MQVIFFDFKKKTLKVQVEDQEDLWYLSHIIDIADKVSSKTLRKIKIDSAQDKSNATRIPITLEIQVEKIDFQRQVGTLRLLGKITQERQDIPKGSFHTLSVEKDTKLTIQKTFWSTYHQSLLNESQKSKKDNILILAFDMQQAIFAITKKYGYEILTELQGHANKKRYPDNTKKDTFYQELNKVLLDYDERYQTTYIIVASPGFFKEDLLNNLKETNKELSQKIVLATCNFVGPQAILEILKRDEIKTIISKTRLALEQNLVDEVLKQISKNGPVTYGMKETTLASQLNSIKILIVTDKLLHDYRQKGQYIELDAILKKTQGKKGEVHIISSQNNPGEKLDSIGGIAAILRYKIT